MIRLHVWLDVKDSNGHYKDCFYGEKIVQIPVFPAMITIYGQAWKQEDTDGFVPCYDVDANAYTLDVDTTLSPGDFDDYVEHVRSIGFFDPCKADEQ